METTTNRMWHHFAPIVLPSPVLAIAAEREEIWVGGAGGVAWYPIHENWQPRISGLPLTSVAALVAIEGRLIAGGAGGIAYSQDKGISWQSAQMQDGIASVIGITISPRFSEDKTLLVATLESGVLRSEDAGENWRLATFGLQNYEITALIWGAGETVLAGTTDGIYRSTNGGRAWRATKGSDGYEVGALIYLPDGTILAALESGGLLYSSDNGANWSEMEDGPSDIAGNALFVTPENTLLWGTVGQGILRSTDHGHTWQCVHESTVLTFAASGSTLYAGLADGLSVSVDDGITWISLPYPPVHDLRHVLIANSYPLLYGAYAGLQRYSSKQAWTAIPVPAVPITVVAQSPEGALIISSPEGLARSTDGGQSWETVLAGETGQVAHIIFGKGGVGWAASADGALLLRTHDGGRHWEQLEAPFGILPVTALQIMGERLLAATYDARQFHVHIWHSQDEGESWQRGMEAMTSWPIIATWQEPALFTLGGSLFLQGRDGQWAQKTIGDGREGIRRVVASETAILVQTEEALYRSTDSGETWKIYESDLPIDQILDLDLNDGTLYALLTGGRVWSHPLP